MNSDAVLLEKYITDVVSIIFKNHKTKPVVQVNPGSSNGDGLLGITTAVTVKLDDDVKYLFMKMATREKQLRDALFIKGMFNKEAYFYSVIRPAFHHLYLNYTQKEFDITPKCFYTSVEELKECIVLDNIIEKQYRLVENKEPLDSQHLLMVLKTYSHLHACGFILKKENPDLFNTLISDSKINFHVQFAKMYGYGKAASACLDVLKQHCSMKEDKDILDNLERIKSNIISSFNFMGNIENYSTIIHTDTWRNNLMFRYKANNKIVEHAKLVDFQMWAVNSPVFDLLHTVYINAPSKEIFDHLDYYMDYYHSSLSEFLVEMGGNPEELFPREVLFQYWKKHACYGLLYGVLLIRGLLAGPEFMANIIKHIKSNKQLDHVFIFALPDEEEYCRRIKIMINYVIKNKFI